ncbi:MAG: glycosyltransferase [Dysgonomonas sp.]|nr:glycosyltransferase [Dysgonomonas sp.]
MMEHILSSFVFSWSEIVVLSLFFLFFVIQLYFYFGYYKKTYSYLREQSGYIPAISRPKVSVIIASENEAIELSKNLPLILDQDYPDFEVIVVNNGSTDESDEILSALNLQYPNLYHTYLPYSNDKKFGRRKLALTLGVKAAKGDVLLFTEPYSKPVSNRWISSMMDQMKEGKEVVLGYSFFSKVNKFFNRVARFDNHLFSMQYFSMAIKGKPYTGVYRNVAFKKHLFFDNKGFASFLNLENGEDVFINQIVTPENVALALSQDSFVETSGDSYSLWKQIKKSYSIAKGYFKSKVSNLFSLEGFSRYLFYILLIGLFVYSIVYQHWALLGISALLFIVRLIIQLAIINKSAKYFHSGKFYFSLILLDILQPIYNFRFRAAANKRVKYH